MNEAHEPEPDDLLAALAGDAPPEVLFGAPDTPAEELAEPPHPVNWHLLKSGDAKAEWFELNKWVDRLRHTYGLTAAVIPPLWHRHPELVWELSALHLHWLACYDPEQDGSAALGWHRDFAEARVRLREWVAASGTRTDRDRPTRQAVWPGEDPVEPGEERLIIHRDKDFAQFVMDDIAARVRKEQAHFATLHPDRDPSADREDSRESAVGAGADAGEAAG